MIQYILFIISKMVKRRTYCTCIAKCKAFLLPLGRKGKEQTTNSLNEQVILVRLRTGHNRLNSHMHRKLKLAPSPTCPCGREEQTTEHVLQRCPLYEATREDVWPVCTSLTTKHYGCKQELEKTTSFISRAALIV